MITLVPTAQGCRIQIQSQDIFSVLNLLEFYSDLAQSWTLFSLICKKYCLCYFLFEGKQPNHWRHTEIKLR